MNSEPRLLSVVVPVMNEEESLRELYQQIVDAVPVGHELELVFVDDGSTDRSWRILESLTEEDERCHAIRLRRNFGKAAALTAGFRAARGEFVFTMDGDLQDDPREMASFIETLEGEGLDLVSGWKRVRHDPWHKTLPSKVFNAVVGWMTGVRLHDHNCGFKLYRREVVEEIRLYGELHRFTPVLASAKGFRVGEVVVHHRARRFGQSKYGWERLLRGLLDLITIKFLTGYGNRPSHLLGGAGLAMTALGIFGMAFLSVLWLWPENRPIGARPLWSVSILGVLLGAQMVSMGLLAELLIANRSDVEATYSIAARTPGLGRQGAERDAHEVLGEVSNG